MEQDPPKAYGGGLGERAASYGFRCTERLRQCRQIDDADAEQPRCMWYVKVMWVTPHVDMYVVQRGRVWDAAWGDWLGRGLDSA